MNEGQIWDDNDALIADKEHWCLSERSDGYYQIQRCDEHDKDWSDFETYCYVLEKADAKSETHMKAIAMHGRRWPK